jgi:hypothetical protein
MSFSLVTKRLWYFFNPLVLMLLIYTTLLQKASTVADLPSMTLLVLLQSALGCPWLPALSAPAQK